MDTRTGELYALPGELDSLEEAYRLATETSEQYRDRVKLQSKLQSTLDHNRAIVHDSSNGPYMHGFDPANLDTATQAELLATGRAQLRPRSKCPCGSGRRFKSCCMSKGR